MNTIKLRPISLSPWVLEESGSNGYITIRSSDGFIVHQDDICVPDEVKCKESLISESINNAIEISKLPDMRHALLDFVNYFEAYTSDCGMTSRGREVYEAAIKALIGL